LVWENRRELLVSKLFAIMTIALGLSVAPFALSAASAADITFGACVSSNTDLAKYQAPGQTGNGPLTIVNGRLIVPAAFDGAVGCMR
jgi:hypothetical protein